jgi:hypothetical protein
MAKSLFFLPGIVFFWVNNPCEVNEFLSTTVVFSVVLPLRTLGIRKDIFSKVCQLLYKDAKIFTINLRPSKIVFFFDAKANSYRPTKKLYCNFKVFKIRLISNASCPFGAIIAGTNESIEQARRLRKSIGGQWRQGGFAAAVCLHSINDLDPIENDHEKAKEWVNKINQNCDGNIWAELPKSNIVMLNCKSVQTAQNIREDLGKGELQGEKL